MLPSVKMVIIALLTYNLQAGGMPPDSKAAFKAEWEALEVFNNLTHTHCQLVGAFSQSFWPDILFQGHRAHMGLEEL